MNTGGKLFILCFCIAFSFNFLVLVDGGFSKCGSMLGQLGSGSLNIFELNPNLLNSLFALIFVSGLEGIIASFLVGSLTTNFTIPLIILLGIINFLVLPLGFLSECPLPPYINMFLTGIISIMLLITIVSFIRGQSL